MKHGRKLITVSWLLFFITFGVTLTMAFQKRAGTLNVENPYLYLVGPLSFLVGAVALVLTGRAARKKTQSVNMRKGVPLEIVGALCNGFAVWMLIMSVVFLVGLIEGPHVNTRTIRLIASLGATIVYLYGWVKARHFSWWGLVPGCAFLFLIVKSF